MAEQTGPKEPDKVFNVNELPARRAADFRSVYSNHGRMMAAFAEVNLVVGEIRQDDPAGAFVEEKLRLILSPAAAKSFAEALSTVVKNYEATYGTIKTMKDFGQPTVVPTSSEPTSPPPPSGR
jgi:hypothetical protein